MSKKQNASTSSSEEEPLAPTATTEQVETNESPEPAPEPYLKSGPEPEAVSTGIEYKGVSHDTDISDIADDIASITAGLINGNLTDTDRTQSYNQLHAISVKLKSFVTPQNSAPEE